MTDFCRILILWSPPAPSAVSIPQAGYKFCAFFVPVNFHYILVLSTGFGHQHELYPINLADGDW